MSRIKNVCIPYKRTFSLVIIFSFIAWLIAIIIAPQSRQSEVFCLNMHDFFADATNTTGLAHNLNPYLDDSIGLQNAAYPPLAYALFYLLAHASGSVPDSYLDYYHDPMWLFLFIGALIISFIAIYTLIIKYTGGRANIDNVLLGIAICVSYPSLHTIERGNIILLTLVALMIYIFYYDSESKIKKEIALLCLAFAAGIKLSPAVFGILLIYKKDWKAAIRAIIYGILVFVLPFFFFEGGIENIAHFFNNMKLHSELVSSNNGTTLENIFFFWYNGLVYFTKGVEASQNIPMKIFFLALKYALSALFLLSGFFMKKSNKLKSVLNITLVLLIFPSVSQHYCIIYLLPVIVIFLHEADLHKQHTFCEKILFVASIFLTFVYRIPHSYSINFKSISLLFFIAVALIYSISKIKNYYISKRERGAVLNG